MVVMWLILFLGTGGEYPNPNSEATEIQRHGEALARNDALLSQLQAANLVVRMASVEAEIKANAITLERIERWLLLIFSAVGGKILLDRRALSKLQSQVGMLEEDQRHIRKTLHETNNALQAALGCDKPSCPVSSRFSHHQPSEQDSSPPT